MIQITTTAWNEKNNKIKRGHWSVGSSDQASTREFDQWVDWSGTSQSRQKDMVYIWPVLLFLRICVCVCPTFKAIDTRKNGWINLWKMKEEWNRFHGAWPLLSFPSFFLVFLLSFSQRKKQKTKQHSFSRAAIYYRSFFLFFPHSSTELLSAATFRKWRLKFASYDGENLFRFHSEKNNNKNKKATDKKEK